jgi:tetratricopeptide (TPR) repeat protein
VSDPRADGAIPSVGDLKQMPLPRLFEEAHRRRLTGALHFQSGEKKKTIFFDEGMVVGARSNLLPERLGQVLVRMGKIDADACGDTLSLQRTRKENIGNIAIDLGLVAEEDLQDGLRRQAEERIGELFRWREGGYAFAPADPGAARVAVIRISAAEAVLLGARLGCDAARLRALLAPLARRFPVVLSTTTSRLGEVRLSPREEALLRMIDGQTALAEFVRGAGPEGRLVLALLYGALAIGLVEMRDAPAAPAGDGAASGSEDIRRRILDRTWICAERDHYAVLELPASAGAGEIRNRYIELARTVHPDRLGLDAPAELRSLAQAVFTRISEAHAVLSNAGSRAAWDREKKAPDSFERKAQEAERALQAEMQYQRGLVHLRRRNLGEALEAFRWAADHFPEEGEYRAYLGWALHRAAIAEGRPSPPEAREALDRAIALRPELEQAHVFLGNLCGGRGHPGRTCFRRAGKSPRCGSAAVSVVIDGCGKGRIAVVERSRRSGWTGSWGLGGANVVLTHAPLRLGVFEESLPSPRGRSAVSA